MLPMENLNRAKTSLLCVSTSLAALCIFSLDVFSPFDLTIGMLYSALFYSCWHIQSVRALGIMTLSITTLAALGFILGESNAQAEDLVHRASMIVSIWIIAALLHTMIHTRIEQRAQFKTLEARENQLANFQGRHALYSEHSPLAAIEWNAAFEVVDWNPAAERMFGYSRAEVIGRNAFELIAPQESQEQIEKIHHALRQQTQSEQSLHPNRTKAGQTIQCRWNNTPLLNNDGVVIGLSSIVEDVSKHIALLNKEKNRSRVLAKLSNDVALKEILNILLEDIERQIPGVKASSLFLDDSATKLTGAIAPSLPEFYREAIDGLEVGDGVGSCGTAIYRGERIVVEDISSHPYWSDFKELAAEAQLASCWSQPIIGHGGKVLGALALYRAYPSSPTSVDLEVITDAANLIALALQKAQAKKAQAQGHLVYEKSYQGIFIVDKHNLIVAVNPSFERITGYSAEQVIGLSPSLLRSDRHDEDFYQGMWEQINTTGTWCGEITNRRADGCEFVEILNISTIYDDEGEVYRRTGIFSDITKKKEAKAKAWHQANYDRVTDLANRHFFLAHLELEIQKARRSGEAIALIYLDLDNFKEANNLLGHNLADKVLRESARRINACTRESDMVACLGADEFTVTLPTLKNSNRITQISQQLLDSLQQPFRHEGESLHLSASIGVAIYPEDANSAEGIMLCAEQAMYASKELGRNTLSYYTPALQESTQHRLRLIKDLRTALKEKQFELHYQPIVDMKTQKIHKAEALIRWHHPTEGMIRPDLFIPLCEETGLIEELGNWVMREAVRQVQAWQHSHLADMRMSINVSPQQFKLNGQLFEQWKTHFDQVQMPSNTLVIEITEGMFLDDSQETLAQLQSFRKEGLALSLDDFGTGYSSLSSLKMHTMDYLKIDQSFVRHLHAGSDDLALCEAIIAMAHKLNMRVVAEGIESQEQYELLNAAGCDFGQGYWLARPQNAESFTRLLTQQTQSEEELLV